MRLIKAGVIGATGYTGSEIVRILSQHPHVQISLITSESRAGEKFSDVHPFFRGIVDDVLYTASKVEEMELDVLFLALPHGVSMEYVKKFAGKESRIVDFSGDFRLASPDVYEAWYSKKHIWPQGFEHAVYGLPEINKKDIASAKLIANPGCFPTGAVLALAPLASEGILSESQVFIDSKTGVTGAGIKPSAVNMFSNVNDNFKAYGLKKHRHTVEIEYYLEKLSGQTVRPVQFTPHLLPVDRGILTTAYIHPGESSTWKSFGADKKEGLVNRYKEFYKEMPFVRLCEKAPPSVKDVRSSNYCDIFVDYDDRTGNIIVISAIDNLVKGAAGLAVQNMNVMFDLDETEGLLHVPVHP
ncbi:N-acetyl-gamma-glutamyl-phosphate reductase [Balneolaceae bacterium ANBcel3]|nr:N-acetyl-gamma-glutamyl-phosphate reductase [Balneolaceae bacterium ANBcel3]